MWDEGSKDYSEEVIRSFICKHGSIVQRRCNQQLSLTNLAAIHAGGSSGNVDNRQFGKEVAALALMGKFRQLANYIPYSKKLWRSKSLVKRGTARHWQKKLWQKSMCRFVQSIRNKHRATF